MSEEGIDNKTQSKKHRFKAKCLGSSSTDISLESNKNASNDEESKDTNSLIEENAVIVHNGSSSSNSNIKSNVKSEIVESTECQLAKQELLVAIISNDRVALPELIEKVFSYTSGTLNYRIGKDRSTLLHKSATQNVEVGTIDILLKNGVRVNSRDQNGCSALHIAAEKGNAELIQYLINNQANPMLKDRENKIALHKGAISGKLQSLEVLLDAPVLINHQDMFGQTALHLAVRFERRDCVEFLVNRNADILITSTEGLRPIDYLPRITVTKKGKKHPFTPTGKKIYKYLKRKGGLKQQNATPIGFYEGIGDGIRNHSLDHRSARFSLTHESKDNNNNPPHPFAPQQNQIHYLSDDEFEFSDSSSSPSERSSRSEDDSAQDLHLPRVNKHGFIVTDNDIEASPSMNLKTARKSAIKDQKRTVKWLALMKTWDQSLLKYRHKIQKYCDQGIPDSVRGKAWKLLSGISIEGRDNTLYDKLLSDAAWDKQTLEQIKKDITRTMPSHVDFQEEGHGQTKLLKVLLAYSAYKPEVGYCQGMGFITAMFLMYMPEEDAFWMLDSVADNYDFAGLWEERMVKVRECMEVLTNLMTLYTPKVKAVIDELGIPAISYGPQFFITGFLYNLPFEMVVRIWDCLWLRGFSFFYLVALSIFKVTQDVTVTFDMDEMMGFLKFKDGPRELDFDADQLLTMAIHLFGKIKPSQIKELEENAKKQFQEGTPLLLTSTSEKHLKKTHMFTPRGFAKKIASKADKHAHSVAHLALPSNNNEESAPSPRRFSAASENRVGKKGKHSRHNSDPESPRLGNHHDGSTSSHSAETIVQRAFSSVRKKKTSSKGEIPASFLANKEETIIIDEQSVESSETSNRERKKKTKQKKRTKDSSG